MQKFRHTRAALFIVAAVAVAIAAYTLGNSAGSTVQHGGVILGVAGVQMNSSRMVLVYSYGIRWLRVDMRQGQQFQAYMANLSADNYSVLGILDYDTVGASINANGCYANCTWTLADWNASVEKAVSMYPWVHVWEVWNEPQIPKYQDGALNASPYSYFLLLRAAYTTIKSVQPNSTVLCLGGDNIYEGGSGASVQDYQWAQQLWGYGASRYCDAVSLHAYSAFIYLLNQTPQGSSQTVGQIFNQSMAQYEALTGKPIWITETGIPSGVNQSYAAGLYATPARQADYLGQALSSFLAKPYIKGVFWYNLYSTGAPYGIDFGLFYPNMTPKPSWYAFRSFLGAA